MNCWNSRSFANKYPASPWSNITQQFIPVIFLKGVLVDKKAKAPLHEYLVNKPYQLIANPRSSNFFLRREGSLTLADSEPEPDLSIVEGRMEDYRAQHPQTAPLVVEVAVTSEEIDRVKSYI